MSHHRGFIGIATPTAAFSLHATLSNKMGRLSKYSMLLLRFRLSCLTVSTMDLMNLRRVKFFIKRCINVTNQSVLVLKKFKKFKVSEVCRRFHLFFLLRLFFSFVSSQYFLLHSSAVKFVYYYSFCNYYYYYDHYYYIYYNYLCQIKSFDLIYIHNFNSPVRLVGPDPVCFIVHLWFTKCTSTKSNNTVRLEKINEKYAPVCSPLSYYFSEICLEGNRRVELRMKYVVSNPGMVPYY
jgi:hypothetical protein